MNPGATAAAQDLVFKINEVFLFPLIALLSALAFVVFLYGAFEYVKNSASQEGRQTGQRHLLYGVIGLLVMFSAFTILQIAAGSFGITVDEGGPPTSSLRPQERPTIWNRAPETPQDSVSGFGSDTSVDSSFDAPAVDDNSGFDSGAPDLAEPSDSDNEVVPGGLSNPNPNPDDTVVDTSSANPDYPVIETWANGTKQISCNNEVGCTGAITSCTGNDHSGNYTGVIGYDGDSGPYVLCHQ